QTDGKVPEPLWFTGNAVGFQGPWGTSYPVNLRLHVRKLTEAEWIERARRPMRPPMPWFNLRDMEDADLVAIYRYLRALGPAGEPAPAAAAPGVAVTTPYIDFNLRNLPQQTTTGARNGAEREIVSSLRIQAMTDRKSDQSQFRHSRESGNPEIQRHGFRPAPE
ncbi:MAG: hypothetical protein WCZ87_04210, partial [Thiohalobacteraceae bacterium]